MAADHADLVPVPRLLAWDRGTWLAGALTVLGMIGVVAWGVVTQPPMNAAYGIGGALFVVLLVGGLALRRHELDTATGDLVRAWGPGFRRRMPWRSARVRLVPNRAGQLQLAVSPPSGRATHLPLLAADLGGARCQAPDFLRLLAAEVERGGHAGVAGRLRAQAEHLAAGGEVLGSPLHRLMVSSA